MNKKITYKDYNEKDPNRYPFFRYHPDPMENGVFVEYDSPKTCQCCGKQETLICEGPFITDEDVSFICPECIADGRAAKVFDMEFCDVSSLNRISDSDKTEELMHHTPGYYSYTFNDWLSHCGDYCAYEKQLICEDLKDPQLLKELKEDPEWIESGFDPDDAFIQIHMFSCLHCGKHLFYIDQFFD